MKTWNQYYQECKKSFPTQSEVSIYDLKLNDITQDLQLDEEYYEIIGNLSKSVSDSFKTDGFLVQANAQSVISASPFFEDIAKICNKYFKDYLERFVFGSYVYCDNIKIYKTPKEASQEKSSWMWHLDNNPKEQVKIMIYLSNVDENAGPFEYMIDPDGQAVKASTRRIDYASWCTSKGIHKTKYCSWYSSRVSQEAVKLMTQNGCKPNKICGNMGTVILFDNNIVHRGSLPIVDSRLAMTLQFRPVDVERTSLVDESYTGNGWEHTTFNKDPEIIENVRR